MEKIFREKTMWEAEDGKEFSDKRNCLLYEKYCNVPKKELLSPYAEFEHWGEKEYPRSPLGIFENCCVVFAAIPEEILDFLYLEGGQGNASFCRQCARYKKNPILLFYDCTDAMNGRGGADWVYLGSVEEMESEILRTEIEIEHLSEFE